MKILYSGTRDAGPEHRPVIAAALMEPIICGRQPGPYELVEGEARGGDRIARQLAAEWGWLVHRHPADWGRLRKAAGPLRNQAMVDGGADLVVATPDARDGTEGGTGDLIDRAIRAGLWINVRPLRIEEATLL